MQIRQTHELSIHKETILFKIWSFARRFERFTLKQIFWNSNHQYNTRQIFHLPSQIYFWASKFGALAVFNLL